MKSSRPYFLNFPPDFQKQNIDKILEAAEKGENIQFVGLKGSGKSLVFRFISTSLEIKNKYDIYSVDFNLIAERTSKAVSELLLSNLSVWEKKEKPFEKKTIILIDSFVNVENISDSLVKIFKAITDRHRDFISFVFSVERPINSGFSYWGNPEYLNLLSKSDFDWFWSGLNGKKEFKNKIYEASGGYMAIIKRIFEISNSNQNLDEVINNPRLNPHLLYQLELMKEGLKGKANYFDVPIYNTFINGVATNRELTALENKAFQFLINNKGIIIERDTLIKAIWGDYASNGIADHALDQIIHRLKQKIEKEGYKLETFRGRGHRLQKID